MVSSRRWVGIVCRETQAGYALSTRTYTLAYYYMYDFPAKATSLYYGTTRICKHLGAG